VRELLAGELGIDSADLKVSSYWKRGVSDFNEH
jgi:NADPH-dependent ferric siderophore reductase